jgi:hypothetical protein
VVLCSRRCWLRTNTGVTSRRRAVRAGASRASAHRQRQARQFSMGEGAGWLQANSQCDLVVGPKSFRPARNRVAPAHVTFRNTTRKTSGSLRYTQGPGRAGLLQMRYPVVRGGTPYSKSTAPAQTHSTRCCHAAASRFLAPRPPSLLTRLTNRP